MTLDYCAIIKRIFSFVCISTSLCRPVGAGAAETNTPPAQKLPWGAGVYGGLGNGAATELDRARWDWVACHSSDSTPERLQEINRLFEINPRQKYQFQLSGNFLSNGLSKNGGVMNFLDYHFDAKRRESLNDSLREQVRGIITGLSKPQNIAAFTFYEELPGNWGYTHLLSPAVMRRSANDAPRAAEDVNRGTGEQNKQAAFPEFLKPYQKQIEQERGKPLVWNEETWRYLGRIYASTINDIHRTIKKASGGMPVYYWLHNGMATLDQLPKDWTFATAQGTECAYSLADIIRPGLCEGLMVYPSCVQRWELLRPLFEKHHWLYFAQLWHPGAERLDAWDATVARTVAPDPWKQGYFFYCEGGGCGRPSGWNDPELSEAEAHDKDRCVMPIRDANEGPAMRITSSSLSGAAFNHQYFSAVHPAIRLQGGKKYRWSVRIKTRDLTARPSDAGPYRGASMFIRWSNGIAQIGEDRLVGLAGTHDWQTYAGAITAPADVVDYTCYLGVWQAKGEAIFTKVSLKAEGDDTELIGNGNFEKFIASPLKFDHWYHQDDSIARSHWRHFCNKHHIGDDVVARYFKLAIEFEKPPQLMQAGRPFSITTHVINTRNTSYYDKAEAAAARDIDVILELPPGLTLDKQLDADKNTLPAGKRAPWQWSVVATKAGVYLLRVQSKSRDMPGTNVETSITVR